MLWQSGFQGTCFLPTTYELDHVPVVLIPLQSPDGHVSNELEALHIDQQRVESLTMGIPGSPMEGRGPRVFSIRLLIFQEASCQGQIAARYEVCKVLWKNWWRGASAIL